MIYRDQFHSIDCLKQSYRITDSHLLGVEILYAAYTESGYFGQSLVFFKKDGVFYIVDASHCSCHGLEGQWDPIETNEASLREEVLAKSKQCYKDFESFILFCAYYFKWKVSKNEW